MKGNTSPRGVRISRKGLALSPLSREVVETTAKIIGPFSTAAEALQRANAIGPTAKFWSTGTSIIVTDGDPA